MHIAESETVIVSERDLEREGGGGVPRPLERLRLLGLLIFI